MKIAFRVDSSSMIGTGHITRCLTLAHYLKERGHDCHFISRQLTGNLFQPLSSPYRHHLLKPPSGNVDTEGPPHRHWLQHETEDDSEECLDLLKSEVFDILIVDHYALDQKWEKKLYPHVKKLVVIDDLIDRFHHCHLYINMNFGVEEIGELKTNADSKVLLGIQYAPLRPEFFLPKKRIRTVIENILLFFGGADYEGFTELFLQKGFLQQFPKIQFRLMTRKPEHKIFETLYPNLEVHLNTTEVPNLMHQSDLYIGSGGTITFERLFMGLPGFIQCVAYNQEISNLRLFQKNLGIKIDFIQRPNDILDKLIKLQHDPHELSIWSKQCYEQFPQGHSHLLIEELLK
ncbi:MAG: UDP-2,4-diacetamido-2,4,6-trideoxy-beta-L-altropyranose hydrolase [Bacteriovoracaceae bacterium]